MNLVEITVNISDEDTNILINLDEIVYIGWTVSPSNKRHLVIVTKHSKHTITNEAYAIALYESFQLSANSKWTQEKLS